MHDIHISLGGPVRIIAVGTKKWHFEDHPRCGPVVVDRRGDPIEQPSGASPFWEAVSLWYAQGKRTQEVSDGTWCIWDKPKPLRMRHLGGRHYQLIKDDESALKEEE